MPFKEALSQNQKFEGFAIKISYPYAVRQNPLETPVLVISGENYESDWAENTKFTLKMRFYVPPDFECGKIYDCAAEAENILKSFESAVFLNAQLSGVSFSGETGAICATMETRLALALESGEDGRKILCERMFYVDGCDFHLVLKREETV
jgi:hypothetical protein